MRSHDPRATTSASSIREPAGLRARLTRGAGAAALSLSAAACSVSYPMYGADDMKTGSIDAPGGVERTAHVASSPLPPPSGAAVAAASSDGAKPAAYATAAAQDPRAPAITPADWAYARGALSLAMGADAVNASVPWANPDTGAYGSFSASAGSVQEHGATCRSFAASHSAQGREQRLEGNACRTAAGYWEAVAIKATASRTL